MVITMASYALQTPPRLAHTSLLGQKITKMQLVGDKFLDFVTAISAFSWGVAIVVNSNPTENTAEFCTLVLLYTVHSERCCSQVSWRIRCNSHILAFEGIHYDSQGRREHLRTSRKR